LPEAPDEDAPRVPGVAGAGLMTSGPLSSGASPGPSLVPVSPARTTPSLFGDVVTPQHSMSSPYATPKRRAALLRPTSAPVRAARGDGAVISAVREDARRLEAARRRTENQLAVIAAAKRNAELRRAEAEAKLAREERKAEEREAERAKKELKRIEKALKKQRDRDKRYDDAKRMERSRSASIMLKHEEEDVRLARAEEERRKELEMQTLKKRLTLEEKMENVEMTERRRQYEAALLLEKIERDTARAKAVNAAREELAQQRRLENYELSLERELLHADAPEIRRVSSIKAKHRPVSARPLGTRWR
jgi:colicin import membrane protein